MFGADGKQMLRLLGKDPEVAMGVAAVGKLQAAIAALKGAIGQDRVGLRPQTVIGSGADGESTRSVRLTQRASADRIARTFST